MNTDFDCVAYAPATMSKVRFILRRNNFTDGLEPMASISRVDAFGGVANREIASGAQSRDTIKDRTAFLLSGARIDRRFIDDNVTALQGTPDRFRGAKDADMSGRRASSIGVGTVMMKKSRSAKSARSVVNNNPPCASSCASTSRVLSLPARSSSTLRGSTSNATTL